jgi:uncharacterized heparinase superfamily protein
MNQRLNKFKRIIATSRHMRPSQIYHRILFMGKRKIAYPFRLITMKHYETRLRKEELGIRWDRGILWSEFDLEKCWKEERTKMFYQTVYDIQQLKFNFLNKEYGFNGDIDWHNKEISHLWRYNLHYFEFGISLGTTWNRNKENISYYKTFKQLVYSWIKHNQQLGQGDGWHPYTLSLRLVNWTYAYDLFKPLINEDPDFGKRFLQSYSIQTLFLKDNVEWDVLGNHLIENGKALVFAGLFLQSSRADSILEKGLSILWGQLNEQVLSDGGHYERSPMYHQIVLRDYLEVVNLLIQSNLTVPEWVTCKLALMLQFQNETLHPDGNIALLNDSAFSIAPSASSIRLLAAKLGIGEAWDRDEPGSLLDWLLIGKRVDRSLGEHKGSLQPISFVGSESGYFAYRGEKLFLIADAGLSCPDFLPAHAHADFGSYELSFGGDRWIVDSGVYQYQGEYRNQFRGTAAHNSLMVNGRNQSDVWGNFRLAERARPLNVKHDESQGFWSLIASHSGYQNIGVIPTRKFFVIDDSKILVLDEIKCTDKILAESFIHLHPDIKIEEHEDYLRTSLNDRTMVIQPIGQFNPKVSISKGMYSPEFGISMINSKIIISSEFGTGKHVIGYLLTDETVDFKCDVNEGLFTMEWEGKSVSIDLRNNSCTLINKNITKERI